MKTAATRFAEFDHGTRGFTRGNTYDRSVCVPRETL